MTVTSLRALTRKALAARAKKHQIVGWHEMTKDELVAALAVSYRRQLNRGRSTSRTGAPSSTTQRNGSRNGASHNGSPSVALRSEDLERDGKADRRYFHGGPLRGRRLLKASIETVAPTAAHDSLIAEGNDPCWVHVRWTLSRDTLTRAEAALGVQWHHAVPILRILDLAGDDAGASVQTRLRDVEIHGDVDHWYLPVEPAPRRYRIQIGYRAPSGLFFVMAQSNRVQTPRPGAHSLRARLRKETGRINGSPKVSLDLEKRPTYDLRALPTSKLPIPRVAPNGNGSEDGEVQVPAEPPVELRLHAELILHGSTDPQVELKLLGERVAVSRDGTFSQRFTLPEGRQVIDAVATTRNGCHQRTIVLGIERNTKELEPQWFDQIES
ncbi:MAG TPA: DUF4912 domain-containing protein [Planctomycetaceae bacterium]|jgi:hypothetical protein|nr:DUF4912 domain-containing protein [Planctomycetaceae bacterium]